MPRSKERSISKIIRFTPYEIERITEKAQGLNFSEYVRQSALHRKNLKFPFKGELVLELVRQGRNLNQIAKKLNENQSLTNIAVIQAINNCFNKIDEIYEFISKQEAELESE